MTSNRKWSIPAVATLVDWWHGDQDPVVPLAVARLTCGRLPAANLRVLAGEGHYSAGWREAEHIFATLIGRLRAPARFGSAPGP